MAFNWLRRIRSDLREREELQKQEGRQRRASKRGAYEQLPSAVQGQPSKLHRIAHEKDACDQETGALLSLDLLEHELLEAVQERRNLMLRRIRKILDE